MIILLDKYIVKSITEDEIIFKQYKNNPEKLIKEIKISNVDGEIKIGEIYSLKLDSN